MKTNTMNLSSADLLAHALLCMPDGPELETVIRNIHRFIFVNGRTGHAELTQAIDGMLYRTFRRAAEDLPGEERPHGLILAERIDDLWEKLVVRSIYSKETKRKDHLLIDQSMDFLTGAKTEEEVCANLQDLAMLLLLPDGALLTAGKWQMEMHLAGTMADELEGLPNLSTQVSRGLALHRFLHESKFTDRELELLSCFHGELFILTAENIHKLNGKHDGKFLKKELDRLARVLSLFNFLRLLSEMNNVEHPHDSVADGVLNDLCTTYQAMLAPVA